MIETTASRPFASTGGSGFLDVADEVAGGIGRGHAGIDEADQVGNRVIAKDQMHRGRAVFVAMDVVELFGKIRGQAPIAVERAPVSIVMPAWAIRFPAMVVVVPRVAALPIAQNTFPGLPGGSTVTIPEAVVSVDEI